MSNKSVFLSRKVGGFDYKSINGDTFSLKVVGVKEKSGSKGAYLHLTAKNAEDPLMPSARCIFPSSEKALWKYDQFRIAAGYKKGSVINNFDDLIGKTFKAKLAVHTDPDDTTSKFIDVQQYVY